MGFLRVDGSITSFENNEDYVYDFVKKHVEINDKIIQKIYESIKRMLEKISFIIVFDHLHRTKNRAGRLLEKVFRKNLGYVNNKHKKKKIEKTIYISSV